MRVFPAGLGPHLVDETAVVRSQEGAGYLLQYMIPILIHAQVRVDEFPGFHPQVFGNPFDIRICKQRARGLAAIGTIQAIGSPELFLVKRGHHRIQVFWWLFAELGEKLLVLRLFLRGLGG